MMETVASHFKDTELSLGKKKKKAKCYTGREYGNDLLKLLQQVGEPEVRC